MTTKQHITIVEDDPDIREMIREMLEEEGFGVAAVGNGGEMDRLFATMATDLVVLDIMLPGEDGLSICRRLRVHGGPRVLMLTARGGDVDRIVGLELGADDYLPKPFNPRELLARVRALMRRSITTSDAAAEILEFADWRVDLLARSVTDQRTGEAASLSSGEFDLLAFFLRHPGRVLDRDRLLDGTRGRSANPFDRAIDVQVSKLRRKLGDDPGNSQLIKTVRGGGYVLSVPVRRVSS